MKPLTIILVLALSCFSLQGFAQRDEIFKTVDVMPEFPGGEEGLFAYLGQNIRYPEQAREAGITGVVYATFMVDKDGTIKNVEVLKGIGGGCDEVAIQVLERMPNWKPGYHEGKPVKVQFNLPIRFTLGEPKAPTVYSFADEMPTYPGGIDALASFIDENRTYPEEAKAAGVKGVVKVLFVIDPEGNIINAELFSGLGHGCDEVALELLQKMPRWNPAKIKGKPVHFKYRLPIYFGP